MPPIEKHVEISLKRTGKPYREVHERKLPGSMSNTWPTTWTASSATWWRMSRH